MATDEIRGALDRLKEWADTIQHYHYRTVVGGGEGNGTWVGHEEFRADLALVESALATERAAARENDEVVFRRWLELGRGDGYRKGYAAALKRAAQVAENIPVAVESPYAMRYRERVVAEIRALIPAPERAQEAACQHWPIYKTQAECAVCHPERAAEEPHAPWCPHVNDATTELCACKTEAK